MSMEEEKYIDIEIDDLLEVTLKEQDDFLKVRETLTRIEVSSRKENKLQSSLVTSSTSEESTTLYTSKNCSALDGLPTNSTRMISQEEIRSQVFSMSGVY